MLANMHSSLTLITALTPYDIFPTTLICADVAVLDCLQHKTFVHN